MARWILDAQYRSFVLDAFLAQPYPDEFTVRFSLEKLDLEFPGAKDKSVGQFIDASFMKAIDQSGSSTSFPGDKAHALLVAQRIQLAGLDPATE